MSDEIFYLHLICCGREAGIYYPASHADAETFREAYTSGPGVDPNGYSGSGFSGHQRAAILRSVAGLPEGTE